MVHHLIAYFIIINMGQDIVYQWISDGAVINGAHGTTFVLTQAEVGTKVSVALEYKDFEGNLESFTSTATVSVIFRLGPYGTAGTVSFMDCSLKNFKMHRSYLYLHIIGLYTNNSYY